MQTTEKGELTQKPKKKLTEIGRGGPPTNINAPPKYSVDTILLASLLTRFRKGGGGGCYFLRSNRIPTKLSSFNFCCEKYLSRRFISYPTCLYSVKEKLTPSFACLGTYLKFNVQQCNATFLANFMTTGVTASEKITGDRQTVNRF